MQGGGGLDAMAEGESRHDRAALADSAVWAQDCEEVSEDRGALLHHLLQSRSCACNYQINDARPNSTSSPSDQHHI